MWRKAKEKGQGSRCLRGGPQLIVGGRGGGPKVTGMMGNEEREIKGSKVMEALKVTSGGI